MYNICISQRFLCGWSVNVPGIVVDSKIETGIYYIEDVPNHSRKL